MFNSTGYVHDRDCGNDLVGLFTCQNLLIVHLKYVKATVLQKDCKKDNSYVTVGYHCLTCHP